MHLTLFVFSFRVVFVEVESYIFLETVRLYTIYSVFYFISFYLLSHCFFGLMYQLRSCFYRHFEEVIDHHSFKEEGVLFRSHACLSALPT